MGRSRTFDETEALEAALALFWAQGYRQTTVQDLVDATGVNRSSLYAIFGGKRALFLRCLQHYGDRMADMWMPLLLGDDAGLDGIAAFFNTLLDQATMPEGRRGCFNVNTATALGGRDAAIDAAVAANASGLEAVLAQALNRAVSRGQAPADTDIAAHAAHLSICAQALRLQARAGASSAAMRAFVDISLQTLPRTTQ